ncbi:NADH dehydrogenase [ubiquinone] 1 alpha subcomplex subunit 11-like [Lepus europaeus]|uniref:NADH dehydrogenase [ubiquinone] 1 alpha subcomplex subunit 11-like n=1 Tax=Lepus europaeus TaxID=9983 RepID=UPI002B48D2F1|nr:NADH dehydrogenase [ubiquinone] 1 alpha subcomplex subunit 11-like [Lepus europaeus]
MAAGEVSLFREVACMPGIEPSGKVREEATLKGISGVKAVPRIAPRGLCAPPRKSRESQRLLSSVVRGALGVRCAGPAVRGALARRLLSQYTDIPDGTDCHRKAYASTIGGAAGLTSAYSLPLKPPGSILEGVARAGQHTFTAVAIGAVFSFASCVSAQVREKPDDPLDYLVGGCAGGLTLGARTHSYGVGAAGCVYLGTMAALVKMGQLEGRELFTRPRV